MNFPGSADRFAGLLHPLDSPKWSKTIVLRVQQAIACFTRPVKKVSKKSAGPQNRTRDLKISHLKISKVVWGVYTGNLVTDRQTDLVSPTPLIGRQKLLEKHFSERSNNKKNKTVKGIKMSCNRRSKPRKTVSSAKSSSMSRDVPLRPYFSREINAKHEFVSRRTFNGLQEVILGNFPLPNDFALFQNVFEMSPDQLASAIKHSHHGTNLHNGIETRKSRLVHSIDISDPKASLIFLDAFKPFERAVEDAVGKRDKWDYATL